MAEYSAFRLLIIAIAAIALLAVLLNYFFFPQSDPIIEIMEKLDFVEANMGTLASEEIIYTHNFSVRGSSLDSPTRSVRFECSSPETCLSDKIITEPRKIVINQYMPLLTHFRCTRKELINDCVVYLGGKPANLEVKIISFTEQPRAGENISLEFQTSNTGSLDAIDLFYSVEVFLKQKEGTQENLILKREIFGEIEKLIPEESKTNLHQFSIDNTGDYALILKVSGEDAGEAAQVREFRVQTGTNLKCRTNGSETPFLEGEMCRTEYSCTGCETAFECASAWRQEGIEATSTGSKTAAYVETESENGTCN